MKQNLSFVNLTDKQRIAVSQEMVLHINHWMAHQYARLCSEGILPREIFEWAKSTDSAERTKAQLAINAAGIRWQPLFGDRDFGAIMFVKDKEYSRLNMVVKPAAALLKSIGNN